MDWPVVPGHLSVSPFIRRKADYSGSAATLQEEAVQATFSSPPHRRAVSPVAYGLD
jgi:hypothetical protein